jgi:hypothetical protein
MSDPAAPPFIADAASEDANSFEDTRSEQLGGEPSWGSLSAAKRARKCSTCSLILTGLSLGVPLRLDAGHRRHSDLQHQARRLS